MNQKARRYCEQCKKAQKACICHAISTIQCDIPLIILQHPSEMHQPIGTARILSLSLSNSTLFIGEDFSDHTELNKILKQSDVEYSVLYPSETAISLNKNDDKKDISDNKKDRNDDRKTKKHGLILLDGTWRKAYKIYQLSTNLHALPTVKINNVEQGNYRIRKSPKEHGLSTVEAGYYALSAMTGNDMHFQPLMTAFDTMIEFQISQMPPGVYERHYN